MDKAKIAIKLKQNHSEFIDFISSLSKEEFLYIPIDKWSAGQQLEHIVLALRPLALILKSPKFILRLVWGSANRPSKDYDGLVNKYNQKLANGGRASGRFVPKLVTFKQREKLLLDIEKHVLQISKSINKYIEEELDQYIIPHPLLGKLTLKEMMYFTIYHVEHHRILTMNNLIFSDKK